MAEEGAHGVRVRSPADNVPFLAVLGNHDLGDSDLYANRPSASPKVTVGGNPYNSNQFNADKNPERPSFARRYWLPDYNYHYPCSYFNYNYSRTDYNYYYPSS